MQEMVINLDTQFLLQVKELLECKDQVRLLFQIIWEVLLIYCLVEHI